MDILTTVIPFLVVHYCSTCIKHMHSRTFSFKSTSLWYIFAFLEFLYLTDIAYLKYLQTQLQARQTTTLVSPLMTNTFWWKQIFSENDINQNISWQRKRRIFMILKAFWCYESVFWRTFWDVERLQCTYLQRSKIANIRNLMQPACTLHFLLIAKIFGLFRVQDA